MTGADLKVEVRDQDMIVTMPETSFRVVYRKPFQGSQLLARLDYFQHDQKGPITRAQFLALASKLANDNARAGVDRVGLPRHTRRGERMGGSPRRASARGVSSTLQG